MTDMFHVGSYLMGTSCLQTALHQSHIAIPLQYLIMSNSTLANLRPWGKDSHTKTVFRVTPDIPLDTSRVLREVSPYQGMITTMRIVVEELRS